MRTFHQDVLPILLQKLKDTFIGWWVGSKNAKKKILSHLTKDQDVVMQKTGTNALSDVYLFTPRRKMQRTYFYNILG